MYFLFICSTDVRANSISNCDALLHSAEIPLPECVFLRSYSNILSQWSSCALAILVPNLSINMAASSCDWHGDGITMKIKKKMLQSAIFVVEPESPFEIYRT